MSESVYRRMFFGAALWNVGGGLFIAAFTPWIFALERMAPPRPAAYYQTWIALVLVFGIGYYMVYRDMSTNRNIAVLGVVGKLAFSAIFIYTFVAAPGQIPRFFIIPVAGDLWFALRFALFLRRHRPGPPASVHPLNRTPAPDPSARR